MKIFINGKMKTVQVNANWFVVHYKRNVFFGHNRDEVEQRAKRYQPGSNIIKFPRVA